MSVARVPGRRIRKNGLVLYPQAAIWTVLEVVHRFTVPNDPRPFYNLIRRELKAHGIHLHTVKIRAIVTDPAAHTLPEGFE